MPQFTRLLIALAICCLTAETALASRTFDCATTTNKNVVEETTDDSVFNALSKIASAAYGSPFRSLQSAKEAKFLATFNNIPDPDRIMPGWPIKIPCYPGNDEVDAMLQAKKSPPRQFVKLFGTGPRPWEDVWAFDEPDITEKLPEDQPIVTVYAKFNAPTVAQVDLSSYGIRNPKPAVAVAKAIPAPAPIATPPAAQTPKTVNAAKPAPSKGIMHKLVAGLAKVIGVEELLSQTVQVKVAQAKKTKPETLYVRYEYGISVPDGAVEGIDVGEFPAIRVDNCKETGQCARTDMRVKVRKIVTKKKDDALKQAEEFFYLATMMMDKEAEIDTSVWANFNGHLYPFAPELLREPRGVTIKKSELPKKFIEAEYEALYNQVPKRDPAIVALVLRPCIRFCLQGIVSAGAGPVGWGSFAFNVGSSLVPREAPGTEPPPPSIQYSLGVQAQEIATLKEDNQQMRKQLEELLRRTSSTTQLAKAK